MTITSSIAAPTGGLAVDIDIVGALNGEFTANAEADCTTNFPVCTVMILPGEEMVELTLTPIADFSTEHRSTDPGESWTASLVGGGGNYNLDGMDTNVDFEITDLIADISIMTSDTTATEGGAIALTIASSIPVPAALTNGLEVHH